MELKKYRLYTKEQLIAERVELEKSRFKLTGNDAKIFVQNLYSCLYHLRLANKQPTEK